MTGVAAVLRPGGKVILDLYHPEWLRRNERAGEPDDRGASVRRWMRGSRCCHQIRYANGQVDDIQFDVYEPSESRDLCHRHGFEADAEMVWWNPQTPASPEYPRYQLVCTRR